MMRFTGDLYKTLEATARGIAYLAADQPAQWQAIPLEKSFVPGGRQAVRERFNLWREAMHARGALSGS